MKNETYMLVHGGRRWHCKWMEKFGCYKVTASKFGKIIFIDYASDRDFISKQFDAGYEESVLGRENHTPSVSQAEAIC